MRLNKFNIRLLLATKHFKTAKRTNFPKIKEPLIIKINYHSRIQIRRAGIANEGKPTNNE